MSALCWVSLTGRGFDRVWIAGGWGVDSLVGHHTRIYSDLDLAVDVTRWRSITCCRRWAGIVGGRGGLATESHCTRCWRRTPVDRHPIVFAGTGWQANVEGQEPFRYPEDPSPTDCLPLWSRVS